MLDGATAQLILIKLSLYGCSANKMKKGNESEREGERDGKRERNAINNVINSAGSGEAERHREGLMHDCLKLGIEKRKGNKVESQAKNTLNIPNQASLLHLHEYLYSEVTRH